MKNYNILILGASSWIGYYLVKSIIKIFPPNTQIFGTYNNNKPDINIQLFKVRNKNNQKMLELLDLHKINIVYNLNRGEDSDGFLLHKNLINYSNLNNCYYVFFSSFNAVDANTESNHYESEKPGSHSEYGSFKAMCENELEQFCSNYCIFRFAATHSWAPNRESRTENFLKKLKNGEVIKINRGIIQNRTETSYLTDMFTAVTSRNGQGIFHLGTVEPSDELVFSRKLATAFGYSKEQIIEGDITPCNAFMVPEKIFQLCGDQYKITEDDVIEELKKSKSLQKYHRI
ncbi:MAG: sugar nucleotide-binding protein [bacterium]|nr:sugar nucleotide-binding protein [bacterium]